MNKFVNTILFFLSFVSLILVVVVGQDIPIDAFHITGYDLPYKEYVFLGIATLFLLIGGRRSAQRWMGVAMIRKIDKFQWNEEVNKKRKKRVIFYLILESLFHTIMGVIFFVVSKDSLSIFIALLVLSADHLLFAILGKFSNIYRVGITKTAVVAVDREVRVLYFSGLRKVSVHQGDIYFNYIKDLVLEFPSDMIADNQRESFRESLKQQIDLDKVYLDESFKNFS